jgi:hypothetical protein
MIPAYQAAENEEYSAQGGDDREPRGFIAQIRNDRFGRFCYKTYMLIQTDDRLFLHSTASYGNDSLESGTQASNGGSDRKLDVTRLSDLITRIKRGSPPCHRRMGSRYPLYQRSILYSMLCRIRLVLLPEIRTPPHSIYTAKPNEIIQVSIIYKGARIPTLLSRL